MRVARDNGGQASETLSVKQSTAQETHLMLVAPETICMQHPSVSVCDGIAQGAALTAKMETSRKRAVAASARRLRCK